MVSVSGSAQWRSSRTRRTPWLPAVELRIAGRPLRARRATRRPLRGRRPATPGSSGRAPSGRDRPRWHRARRRLSRLRTAPRPVGGTPPAWDRARRGPTAPGSRSGPRCWRGCERGATSRSRPRRRGTARSRCPRRRRPGPLRAERARRRGRRGPRRRPFSPWRCLLRLAHEEHCCAPPEPRGAGSVGGGSGAGAWRSPRVSGTVERSAPSSATSK